MSHSADPEKTEKTSIHLAAKERRERIEIQDFSLRSLRSFAAKLPWFDPTP
jgi:hypothetical protein